MSEATCNVCSLEEPLPVMITFPDYYKQIIASKNKQQMLNVAFKFMAANGAMTKEVKAKMLGA